MKISKPEQENEIIRTKSFEKKRNSMIKRGSDESSKEISKSIKEGNLNRVKVRKPYINNRN